MSALHSSVASFTWVIHFPLPSKNKQRLTCSKWKKWASVCMWSLNTPSVAGLILSVCWQGFLSLVPVQLRVAISSGGLKKEQKFTPVWRWDSPFCADSATILKWCSLKIFPPDSPSVNKGRALRGLVLPLLLYTFEMPHISSHSLGCYIFSLFIQLLPEMGTGKRDTMLYFCAILYMAKRQNIFMKLFAR